ncbi:hypothetical protein Taro_043181, partial [Colocasia esculenta]|nr:hypothetical protein [Colocasia esculenta]
YGKLKNVTSNKVLQFFKSHSRILEIPEVVYHLIKKVVAIRNHIEDNNSTPYRDGDTLAAHYCKRTKRPPRLEIVSTYS